MAARPIVITITGIDKLIKDMEKLGRSVIPGAAKGLYRAGEAVMTRSKQEFVPVDLGALRSTGHVDEPVQEAHAASVTLGFGGPSGITTKDGLNYVGYALWVHEILGRQHPVGGPKYLERPLREDADSGKIGQAIADAIGEEFG